VVAIVNGANVFAHLLQPNARFEIAEQIVVFGGNSLVLVPEPEIQSNSWLDAPVVLHVAGIKPLGQVARGVPRQKGGVAGCASEKSLQTGKIDPASSGSKGALMDKVSTHLATELECMLAAQIGELVNKVVDFIGPDNFWKVVKGPQFCEAWNVDVRYALQERVGNASVDFVWETDIAGKNVENVMCEASAEFIGPLGTRRPRPMARHILRSGMNLGTEL